MGTVSLLDLLGCLQEKQGSWEVYHVPEAVPGLLHAISHLTTQGGAYHFLHLMDFKNKQVQNIEVLALGHIANTW